MPFISFIVPVYNIKKYLPACVESIASQPFSKWEIILIDNKSDDGSECLCDQYAARDARIKVVHLTMNEGPGMSRNEGILHASGDYVFFLDGDDTIAAGKIPKLWESIEKCGFPDMMFVDYSELFGWSPTAHFVEYQDANETVSSVDDFLRPFLGKSKLGFYVWQFVIKRHLLINHEISFRTAWIGEDIDFTLRSLFSAKAVGTFGSVFYNYRTRLSGSLSLTSGHIKYWDHIVKSAAVLLELAHNKSYSVLQKEWVYHNVLFLLVQFEAIAGAIPAVEISNQSELFLPFENHMEVLEKYIIKNGLLWYIQALGSRKGTAVFCQQRVEEVNKLLYGRDNRDIFVFPATRKSSRLIGLLVNNGYRCKGMLDNDPNKQGLILDGQVIFNPHVIPQCYDDDSKLFVIISTATRRTGTALADQLRNYGLEEGRHFTCAKFEED